MTPLDDCWLPLPDVALPPKRPLPAGLATAASLSSPSAPLAIAFAIANREMRRRLRRRGSAGNFGYFGPDKSSQVTEWLDLAISRTPGVGTGGTVQQRTPPARDLPVAATRRSGPLHGPEQITADSFVAHSWLP